MINQGNHTHSLLHSHSYHLHSQTNSRRTCLKELNYNICQGNKNYLLLRFKNSPFYVRIITLSSYTSFLNCHWIKKIK